jgi:4-hydroxy-3-methylbut-2-enyl diphosphate reductase
MKIDKIYFAKPRGFCAGVARAVDTVTECLEIFGAPVYVKHEIVHNKTVVKELADKGAITVEDPNDLPDGCVVVFSAHGSPPEHYEIAKAKKCRIIDATCPLVTKVHIEVHKYVKEDYKIVYIGHKGHVEGIGVRGEAKHTYNIDIPLVESKDEIDALPYSADEKIAYLTQTTLSVAETEELIGHLKEKYPNIHAPSAKDICYATTNRQQAIRDLAERCDVVFVVGSKNSSNSNRLREVAQQHGARAYLIDNTDDIEEKMLTGATTVGISAGASAPEHVVQSVAAFLRHEETVLEELNTIVENMKFIEPMELAEARKHREHNT